MQSEIIFLICSAPGMWSSVFVRDAQLTQKNEVYVWMVCKLDSVCRTVCSVCCLSLGTGISGFLCVHNVYSVFPLCFPAVSTKQCYDKAACLTAPSISACYEPHAVCRFYWTGFYLTSGHLLALTGNTLTPREYAKRLNCSTEIESNSGNGTESLNKYEC